MIGVTLAAAIAALNPAFIGDWCANVKGVDTEVMSISKSTVTFYPDTAHREEAPLICMIPKAVLDEKSYDYDDLKSIRTQNSVEIGHMMCHQGKNSESEAVFKLKWTLGPNATLMRSVRGGAGSGGGFTPMGKLGRCSTED